ncbi:MULTISPECIES: potassium channel family protein [Halolamina]|uniref:TrkA-C domain-containing protein n=1 Tax=Halolamina pelagica TaxID=699431 RepID=A0A1I5THI3_9EURY|nr:MULTISPECIES: TrkA C-terminal domain-containing protein [Halolamina]NHX37355.1 potassium transporter TrkA [Halolamina sp. R1-12]SFP82520.1 TrkA-C domain-containing protein [Halolamina pelagica]
MASFPLQILLGVYLGLVTGIVPALVAWVLGFTFKYFTNVSIPGFGVIVLALAIAGVNGGLLALNDRAIVGGANGVAVLVAIVVVLMLSMYAHAKGDQMGAATPKRLTLKKLADRTLSADVVDFVGGRGEVNLQITGEVGDVEGYPPLPTELRREIREASIALPADLPISELEHRAEDRLRSDFDLADVSVRIDERGHASVAAAPPTAGLSKRVPAGKRAVSLTTMVPTGTAAGDEVAIRTAESTYEGTVVSVRPAKESGELPAVTDGGAEVEAPSTPAAKTAAGGRDRVTVAVAREAAGALLEREVTGLTVRSRGERREFELLALLRRSGKRLRRVTVREGGALDGHGLGEVGVHSQYGVVVLAARGDGGWTLVPGGGYVPEAGQELFVVGTAADLDAFAEVAA